MVMLPASVWPPVPDPGIRAHLTESARWQAWLDVEVALAKAEAELGIIPAEVVPEIERKAKLELLDRDRILEGLSVTGHPLVPLIWEFDRICEGDAGGYIHWGATTQNITQTGQLLLIRRVHHVILGQLSELLEAYADLAERTKDMALPGRTHGQHAVPATFGLKVATWIDETCRHVERLRALEPRLFVAMLGGGAGTMAGFGPQAFELADRFAKHLDMRAMPVPARTIHDHQAEYVWTLAMVATTCSRVAHEIFTLMKEEFGEVEEPISEGAVGSSTMPQKRNPKYSQSVMGLAAQVRAVVPLALEAMREEHEADATTGAMIGRATNDACTLTGDILLRMILAIRGLQVFPERMRQNLDLSGGLIMSEALMLELGAAIGRQRAHDAIYEAAQASANTDRPFRELLAESDEVRERLSPEQIETLLDPERYTGMSSAMAEQQAGRAREVASTLKGVPAPR